MPYPDDIDQQNASVNFVDDPVISDPDPVGPLASGKFLVPGREWVDAQAFDCPNDFRHFNRWDSSQVFFGRFPPLNPIGGHLFSIPGRTDREGLSVLRDDPPPLPDR